MRGLEALFNIWILATVFSVLFEDLNKLDKINLIHNFKKL